MDDDFDMSELLGESDGLEPVAGWLKPLDDSQCGENLEYEAEFLAFNKALEGKPETQFSPAEPPAWREVLEISQELMGRTRDLRVAIGWSRAMLNLEGLAAIPEALRLLHGMLDRFWDNLYPSLDPDDGDAFERISALGSLEKLDGMLGEVRQALLSTDRRLGGLSTRDVEIALERLDARPDETPRSTGEIKGMLEDFSDISDSLRQTCEDGLARARELQDVMNDKLGFDSAVDMKSLIDMLKAVQSVLPEVKPVEDAESAGSDFESDFSFPGSDDGDSAGGRPSGGRGGGGLDNIDSREDALKAINAICEYLERTEPTNPAQLFLRRAERLISKSFLELVRDLAPESLNEVARVMGVDPESVS